LAIGIIGDYSSAYPSQHATNDALEHSINKLGVQIKYDWISTAI
jgi:CTP synthase (UTP-ammonia lyase)